MCLAASTGGDRVGNPPNPRKAQNGEVYISFGCNRQRAASRCHVQSSRSPPETPPMVFFTRENFLGLQPKSGWERRAEREWRRRADLYARYAEGVAPMLPAAVRRLCNAGLHDGVVREASAKAGKL